MATFWERAAHSVNPVFSLLCQFVALIVSHFGFKGRTLTLIASVPGHCLLLYPLFSDQLKYADRIATN